MPLPFSFIPAAVPLRFLLSQPDGPGDSEPGQEHNVSDNRNPGSCFPGQVQADDGSGQSQDPQDAAHNRPFSFQAFPLLCIIRIIPFRSAYVNRSRQGFTFPAANIFLFVCFVFDRGYTF